MSTPVLVFDKVRKSYGSTEALKGISFDIAPSEVVGLLGPNGAGKSTLFQIAAGLFAPDDGTVDVFGLDYKQHASEILARLGVVFQSRSLDLDMTVNANLKFHGQLFGLSGKLLETRISEVTELLEVADLRKRPVRTLSGGNQRRVEIARALLNKPDLLLMDEPSVGLDATTRRKLVDHMQVVREQQGTSILWATHLVEEVDRADRIVFIAQGEVTHMGSPAQIIETSGAATLTDAYVALTGGADAHVEPAA
ncbi:ABC transporter ATP-binding protein [Paradevosia shaoguanensis]|uniref:ATP-binding cassette domain-containing protein n=1 Tax=Paradevosia shaoguanensis TaxID=1335043 RepID=A0AA41QP63_9HYPH|nr:ATP-binding cassette domain-containing protein [Paradevosia shaoguanensis]MCF1743726.1 ATP-binding cassette domain-containing protein [Paradevosia shaoguanensis]MCI0128209.1 ATP-binding cassette domain-containing protein [Paradevosia shaoguanensis]